MDATHLSMAVAAAAVRKAARTNTSVLQVRAVGVDSFSDRVLWIRPDVHEQVSNVNKRGRIVQCNATSVHVLFMAREMRISCCSVATLMLYRRHKGY